ncbi:TRAP transporter small permease [Pseudomonadota bacterium]
MKRLLKTLHFFEDSLLAILLGSMVMLATSQIFLRNFWNSGVDWIDPTLRVLVLWIGLVGAMVASRELNHINIDVVSRLLPKTGKRIVTTITNLFSAIICAIVSYHAGRFVMMEYEDNIMAFDQVPAWVCEIIMPIGFGVMALRFLAVSIGCAMGEPKQQPHSPEERPER